MRSHVPTSQHGDGPARPPALQSKGEGIVPKQLPCFIQRMRAVASPLGPREMRDETLSHMLEIQQNSCGKGLHPGNHRMVWA